jgi:hypothetical protein
MILRTARTLTERGAAGRFIRYDLDPQVAQDL